MSLLIEVRKYGTGYEIYCSECGQVDFTPLKYRYTKRDIWEHRRHAHPTPEENEADELRRAERELDACERCGQEGHEPPDCPNVQPWMLKKRSFDPVDDL